MKALLIIPAVNEGTKLEMTAQKISDFLKKKDTSFSLEVMIVDDGSTTSATEDVAKRHDFLCLRNSECCGVGYSIRKAYDFGAEHGFDVLITMAGNNKDNPDEIPALIAPILNDQADFVQGSRYLSGGAYGNMPGYRFITTKYLHPLLFSFVAGKRITDSTNGFRAIRTSILRAPEFRLHETWLDHYELEPYVFCQAIRLGYRVTEVPVTKIYPDKKLGYSKMKPITGWWSILRPLVFIYFKLKT